MCGKIIWIMEIFVGRSPEMKVLIAILKFMICGAVAVGINFGIYTSTVAERDYEIRKDLAESGITIKNYEFRQGLLIIEIPALDSEMEETDVMLIRKTLDALRDSDMSYGKYYIRLVDPNGKIIYSDMFTNINFINSKYASEIPEKTIDNNTYRYLLKYYFAENEINMTAFNFYETKGMENEALYMEICCEKSTLSDTVEKTITQLRSYNDNGAVVLRYSVVFKNAAGESLCAISTDEYYNDTIYWKAPNCAGIKTIYDQ